MRRSLSRFAALCLLMAMVVGCGSKSKAPAGAGKQPATPAGSGQSGTGQGAGQAPGQGAGQAPGQGAGQAPGQGAGPQTPVSQPSPDCVPTAVASGIALAAPSQPAGWQRTFPVPTSRNLTGVAYGNSRFVAVGEGGTVLTSPDGAQWKVAAEGSAANLRAVAFGGGRFFAAGAGGGLYQSTDGQTWTATQVQGTVELIGIAYGQGRFVAPVKGGGVLTSVDGGSWSTCPGDGTELQSITFQGQLFGAFSPGGGKEQPPSALYISADGLSWTKAETVHQEGQQTATFVYGRGEYFAIAALQRGIASKDGRTWQSAGVDYPAGGGHWGYGGGQYGNDRFVLAANACDPGGCGSNLISSTDRRTFQSIGLTEMLLRAMAFGIGRFVGVGDRGKIITTDGMKVLWENRTTQYPVRQVAFGNGRFVALGTWVPPLVSSDGLTWSHSSGPRTAGFTSSVRLIFAGGRFVAAGAVKHTGWVVYSSFDGTDWGIPVNISAIFQGPSNGEITGLGFHKGRYWLKLADGRVLGSDDAKDWTEVGADAVGPEPAPPGVTVPGESVVAAAAGPRQVVITERGEIFTSSR